jgi:hypothetical protein
VFLGRLFSGSKNLGGMMTRTHKPARTVAAGSIAVTAVLALAACSSPAPTPTVTITDAQTVTPSPVAEEVEQVGELTGPQAWGLCYALTVKGDVLGRTIEPPLYADSVVEARSDDSWFIGFNGDVATEGVSAPGRTWCLISGPPQNFNDIAHASEVGKAIEDLDPQADRGDAQFSGSAS